MIANTVEFQGLFERSNWIFRSSKCTQSLSQGSLIIFVLGFGQLLGKTIATGLIVGVFWSNRPITVVVVTATTAAGGGSGGGGSTPSSPSAWLVRSPH